MRANRLAWGLGAAIVALGAVPVLAETAQMTGRFPAPYRDAAMLTSLSVGRIDGRDGHQVGSAIERALGQTGHFQLQGGRRNGGNADGRMEGGVSSSVEDSYFKRKEKRCTQRDDNDKCLKEEEVEVRCTRRIASLNASLRIVRYDGQLVYSVNKPLREQVEWCEGQNAPRLADDMISSLVNQVAQSVRSDIVPRTDTYRIRFLEGTKGLPKEAVKPFKDIVKQTQRDLRTACQRWAEMDRAVPNNLSITFNLGLCAEASGDLRAALGWYQRAAQIQSQRGGEAATAVGRIQGRIAQDRDDAERARLMRG